MPSHPSQSLRPSQNADRAGSPGAFRRDTDAPATMITGIVLRTSCVIRLNQGLRKDSAKYTRTPPAGPRSFESAPETPPLAPTAVDDLAERRVAAHVTVRTSRPPLGFIVPAKNRRSGGHFTDDDSACEWCFDQRTAALTHFPINRNAAARADNDDIAGNQNGNLDCLRCHVRSSVCPGEIRASRDSAPPSIDSQFFQIFLRSGRKNTMTSAVKTSPIASAGRCDRHRQLHGHSAGKYIGQRLAIDG